MAPSSAALLFVALAAAGQAAESESESRHHRHHRHHRHLAARHRAPKRAAVESHPPEVAVTEGALLASRPRQIHRAASGVAAPVHVAASAEGGSERHHERVALLASRPRPGAVHKSLRQSQRLRRSEEPPSEAAPEGGAVNKTGADGDGAETAGGKAPAAPAAVVAFGLLVKKLYSVDFKEGTVMADVVMTLRWDDNRTVALVPQGESDITLAQDRASKLMWMPVLQITNKVLESGGTQVTSTGVTVSSTGQVQKVQRILAMVHNNFDIRAYPFDSQSFKFRVASATLMAEELQLTVLRDEGLTGVKDGIFQGREYDFVSTETHVFEDRDGRLVKSRGELVIVVQRNSEPYVKNLLVPCLTLVAIAYTVFLFPLTAAFIMPRVMTSLVTFMSLMVLSLKTAEVMPTRGATSWMDVFEEACQMMMFTTLSMNIIVEMIEHELVQHPTARRMQLELRCAMPVVEIVIICICFSRTDGTELWWLSLLTKGLLIVLTLPYLCWCGKRVMDGRKHDAEHGK